jgi:phosphoglucomutase
VKTTSWNTSPFPDQKPGTAGLRKKVSVIRQPGYLENFIQAVFDAAGDFRGSVLVAGGDGRFYNDVALQTLARIAAGNGVRRLITGRGGMLSTPAASNLIRRTGAAGGFLLTASHNPGGPDGDFGIKFNNATGGQASETMMDRIHRATESIHRYLIADIGPVDLGQSGTSEYGQLTVEVIDPVAAYADLMEELFDFDLVAGLFRSGFTMRFDAMNAVTGPYATEILHRRLGAPESWIMNGRPLPDFGGGHPDPNPVDAAELVAMMAADDAPAFAAASDGDGDRNMILGPGQVVSPGDSLAVMAANATRIPGYAQGLAGVARSMPTSQAIDVVADDIGIPCYETPTGWRYFCNLLDAGRIDLCGEESFGTGSSHVREKDGLWAVLFWLNLIARTGRGVADIVQDHWRRYGRNAFNREDFFIPDASLGQHLIQGLEDSVGTMPERRFGDLQVGHADVFEYHDPVDSSMSAHQGVRVFFQDGSRVVYRLSGTGTSGATLRMYLERRVTDAAALTLPARELNAPLSAAGRSLARIRELTGVGSPTAVV